MSDRKTHNTPEGQLDLFPDTREAPTAPPTLKPSNPKDAFADGKIPVHLWPPTATMLGSIGLLSGAVKYGRGNFRATGVRASVYYDALMRHAQAWFEGQDLDEGPGGSGQHQFCHMLACIAILADAWAAGVLVDDRQFPGGYHSLVERLTPEVKALRAAATAAGLDPKHYTIADAEVSARRAHAAASAPKGKTAP